MIFIRLVQSVRLMEDDEHTILSRIRYPDVESASLVDATQTAVLSDLGHFQLSEHGSFGEAATTTTTTPKHPTRKKLIIGMASMARPKGRTNYLLATLHSLFSALKDNRQVKKSHKVPSNPISV